MKTKLEQAFDLFVSEDNRREQFKKPFLSDGYIYATDFHTLIRVSEKDCDFTVDLNNNPTLNAGRITPASNVSIPLNIDIDFNKYKTEDALIEVDCETCNGEGEVEWEYERWTKEEECPNCDGRGYFDKIDPSAAKTFGKVEVKIDRCFFNMEYIQRLVQIKELLDEEIVLINKSHPAQPNLFKVGKCEVLIMPIYHFYDNLENIEVLEVKI